MHRRAVVIGKRQRFGRDPLFHGRYGGEVSTEILHIVTRHLRVGVVGHRWVKRRAVSSNSFPKRSIKLRIAPRSNPGFEVRRDVRRDDATERGLDHPPSGKRSTRPRDGMAAHTVTGHREIPAPFYL